jgi:serine protease Do
MHAGGSGIGFAIPIDVLKEILPQLRQKGFVERGKLGVTVQPLTADLARALGLDAPMGALVVDVEPRGPAARAGIQSGDVITAIDGKPIRHADELARNVARNAAGSKVAVSVRRRGGQRDVVATLEKLEDEKAEAAAPKQDGARQGGQLAGPLGIRVSNAPGGGVRVDELPEGREVGDLAPGDVIVQVGETRVDNVQTLRGALSQIAPGTTALFKLRRGDREVFAAVPIPRAR